ncbi:hypothetical protein EK21DRAFT_91470 [Setomelanomma holmii]|uniref:BHLH domain-containing protein n=1 Tax=Setomelanomma holmii TaxID=210430 RepID=A0A9P4LKF0_9PLEO|nr:hypothetical protein EK21DRAFT_91470 [Setomelanomma holmii]
MGDKDPSPFGYTFNRSFLDPDPASFDPNQSLLTDAENQSIADFFTNTNPFHLSDPHAFAPATDTKDSIDGFNDWSSFVTPATVHGVSTTIPDQSQLHNNFFNDTSFAQPPLHANHYGTTHDDLQAAETLFNNSQQNPYSNNRSHSFHGAPSSSRNLSTQSAPAFDQNGKPLVITPHGLINEQLAALLPKYGEEGTIDAQLAAQWATSDARQRHESEYGEILRGPSLKRSYTFGTDDSFNNPTGFSAAHGQETTEQVTERLLRDLRHAQPLTRTTSVDAKNISPTGHIHLTSALPDSASDEEQSEVATSDEDEDDRPSKKRRKSSHGKSGSQKRARNSKVRKGSSVEENGKKKRNSAAQKAQRENLTEEQKRNNHILSEQKRRNLIKRGFDELHDLVPEIRNGGLSKSSVLTEAANFLEKLIEENIAFRQLTGG